MPVNPWITNSFVDSCAFDPKYDGKSLRSEPISYALRTWKGRVIDTMRLVKDGTEQRANKWRIDLL